MATWSVSATGAWFRAVQYGVRKETGRVDMDDVRELALAERPKVIFCGGTAIPRTIAPPMNPARISTGPSGATSRSTTVPWILVMKIDELELRNELFARPKKISPGTMNSR